MKSESWRVMAALDADVADIIGIMLVKQRVELIDCFHRQIGRNKEAQ